MPRCSSANSFLSFESKVIGLPARGWILAFPVSVGSPAAMPSVIVWPTVWRRFP